MVNIQHFKLYNTTLLVNEIQPCCRKFSMTVIAVLFLLNSIVSYSFAKTLADASFAFNAEAPVQWVLSKSDTSLFCLSDESKQFKAKIYLQRTYVDTISILEESEYAKTFFISNLSVARTYGTVMSWDTTTTLRVGPLRAYDMYAHYKPKKGSSKWFSEYGRWCSKNHFLFQLTIFMDDTIEIDNHIEEYITLLNAITVWDPAQPFQTSSILSIHPNPIETVQPNRSDILFDLCGRKFSPLLMHGTYKISGCKIVNGKMTSFFSGLHGSK